MTGRLRPVHAFVAGALQLDTWPSSKPATVAREQMGQGPGPTTEFARPQASPGPAWSTPRLRAPCQAPLPAPGYPLSIHSSLFGRWSGRSGRSGRSQLDPRRPHAINMDRQFPQTQFHCRSVEWSDPPRFLH